MTLKIPSDKVETKIIDTIKETIGYIGGLVYDNTSIYTADKRLNL